QINHMGAGRPLSAASYRSWSDTVKSKTEEVVRETNVSGNERLTIRTAAAEPIAIGNITVARFTIRASDYHPTELYLHVKTADGEREFDLAESEFEVVNLTDVDPSIFAGVPATKANSLVVAKSQPTPA